MASQSSRCPPATPTKAKDKAPKIGMAVPTVTKSPPRLARSKAATSVTKPSDLSLPTVTASSTLQIKTQFDPAASAPPATHTSQPGSKLPSLSMLRQAPALRAPSISIGWAASSANPASSAASTSVTTAQNKKAKISKNLLNGHLVQFQT